MSLFAWVRIYDWYDKWGKLQMIQHLRISVLSLVRNYSSKKPFISYLKIIHIRLFYQIGPSLGTYIRKTRYQLIYDNTSQRLTSPSGSYIWKAVHQLVQHHTHWNTSHYYQNCTSGELYTNSSKIRRIRFFFQEYSIIGLSIRLFSVFYFSDA